MTRRWRCRRQRVGQAPPLQKFSGKPQTATELVEEKFEEFVNGGESRRRQE